MCRFFASKGWGRDRIGKARSSVAFRLIPRILGTRGSDRSGRHLTVIQKQQEDLIARLTECQGAGPEAAG